MNALEAIAARRSIRKFKADPIRGEDLREIVLAGLRAPSGKNRQPWRLVVVRGERRAEMVRVFRAALAAFKARGEETGSAEWTANVMEKAPVTVFVLNPHGADPWLTRSADQAFQELVDVQSIGAAIENMLLAALDLGIGSLWIADVLYAVTEFKGWLGESGQLVAAVSFGYPDERPEPRSRKGLDEVVSGL